MKKTDWEEIEEGVISDYLQVVESQVLYDKSSLVNITYRKRESMYGENF